MMIGRLPLSPAGVITGTNARPPHFGETVGPDPYSADATMDVSFFDERAHVRFGSWPCKTRLRSIATGQMYL
jgi:hypothetical protein